MSRHPFDYLFGVDPFDDLYVDCDPEENLHDMFDLPASYSSRQPRPIYVYETKKRPNGQKTEDATKKNGQEPKWRNTPDSANDKPVNRRNGDAMLLDLDQLVKHLFKNLYAVNGGSRCRPKTDNDLSKTKTADHPEGKDKQLTNTKPSLTERTANSQREPVKENEIDTVNKQQEMNTKNLETEEKMNIEPTLNEENVITNKETIKSNDEMKQTESDDVRVVFVIEDNADEEDKDESAADASLMDTQEESTQEDGSEKKTEDTETTNAEKDCKQTDSADSDTKMAEEVESSEKFQVTFDLSSFYPEEIQVKLSDERLILDAVHEEVNEGSVEKQSLQKVILLPPGVDTESLRCRLSDDGHMTISADYIGKSKESKILTIEKQTAWVIYQYTYATLGSIVV